jgi:hypothetical protein
LIARALNFVIIFLAIKAEAVYFYTLSKVKKIFSVKPFFQLNVSILKEFQLKKKGMKEGLAHKKTNRQ